MFIYQGQKSFYLWNKINPEVDDELLKLTGVKIKLMKIGITGSLSSGKSSVAKILSKNKKLLFSADKVVKEFIL